jgi:hypothetical protein
MPDAQAHPQPRVEKNNTRVSHHGRAGSPGIPAREWFYGFLRALPGDRACLSPSPAQRVSVVAVLTPASGRQDHTTSPSASRAIRQRRQSVHRIPRPTSVTIAKRPSVQGGGTREVLKMICPTGRAKYFYLKDWTDSISLIGFDKFAVWRKEIGGNVGLSANSENGQ